MADAPKDLRDRVMVVLGGSGGIGGALCRELARRGAAVVATGRDEARLRALQDESDVETVVLDAAERGSIEALLERVQSERGRLDGVANCIGSVLLKPAHLTRDEDWDAVLRANLDPAFATVRGAARVMRATGGAVVLTASAAALCGLKNHEAVAAAKAGVIGLARAAAATYAAQGLRCNVVAPGLVRTGATERITATEAGEKASLALHPLGRLGEAGDVARAMAWFLDPANDWITGEVLSVDGGLARVKTPA
jgi:NAD(P)-dependent dehydrogenase (short-subunit alcohol dehydrogenase family)